MKFENVADLLIYSTGMWGKKCFAGKDTFLEEEQIHVYA